MTNAKWASDWRAAVNQLLSARASLKALREQDTAVAVANAGTGVAASIQAADLTGTNADLTSAAFVASMSSMDSLEQLLTDFTKVPPQPTATLQALLKLAQ